MSDVNGPQSTSQSAPQTRSRRRRGAVLAARSIGTIAIVSVVVGVLSVMAGALFSSTDFVSNNTFTMSTVILDATPNSAAFAVPSMGPGEESLVEFNIANTGNAELRYAMTSETTEDVLAAALIFTVREGVTTCDQASWDATGAQIYQGKLGDTTTIDGWPTFGDTATGGDTGDRVLAPATDEALCFHVMLPASSTVQNTSTNATFHFMAEQTANN